MRKQSLSPYHPALATTNLQEALSKRAATLLTLKRYDDARHEIDAALAMFEAVGAGQSLEGLVAGETHALILHRLGQSGVAPCPRSTA